MQGGKRSDELAIQNAIQLSLVGAPARLLRNNVGMLRDATGRPVAYGLGSSGGKVVRGPSDLIGWRTITITPDMVGQTVAVFTAIEVKDHSKPTPEQEAFIATVQAAGGIAGVARSTDDARHILGM